MNHLFRFFLTLSLATGLFFSVSAKNTVGKLICEYLVNPVGIEVQNPRLSWQIQSDGQNVIQTAYEIRVTDPKGNLIWNSGKVESDQSVNVEYGGPALKSMQRAYWQVRIWDKQHKATAWSAPAYWETGILSPDEWKASWISIPSEVEVRSKPSPFFRNEFSISKKVQSARVYVTSLGLYQLYMNGQKVSSDLFTPGWTSYNKRLQYQTYDVTALLQPKNGLGAILGDGWYRGNIGWGNKNGYYGDKVALLAQLVITYADGTTETIATDRNWKVTTGPIISSDIYNGETYDARLEMSGWSSAGFDDSNWGEVAVPDLNKNVLTTPQGVPVRAIQEIKPVKLMTTPKGETVFDMGQNMVGWVRLNVRGKAGDRVVIKFAEVLDKEGNFYTDNLRSAKCTDVYILKGGAEEVYEPHFTFHGFRFVKLEEFPGTPSLENLTGVVIHSDMPPTGTFACSDSLINQLQQNIQWGQRGNFLDVPTDCPQRDERLGWTGDAQVFSTTAAFNYDVAGFYTKWMKDLAADQLPDGKVPHVIPDVLKGDGGSTAWADAALVVPWTMYLSYGDKRILEEQYPSMKAWVDYMKNRAGEDYLWTGDQHFGDWLAFASDRSDYTGATTEKDLIATAYYFYSAKLLGKIASIIGNTADSEKYALLTEGIKKAFNAEFVTPNGRLASHTQTAYSLALAFDLLPENLVSKAAAFLAEDVRKFGHLTTGFVGTPLLCKTLSAHGYDELAFMLLNRKEYPSWLYPVTQGATTIWERWDGQKPDGTFQNVGMNSFNHYAYGAIGEWMYNHVAGINIDPQHPAYKHILLKPHPGGGLTNARADFLSLYGPVKSAWSFEGEDFIYEVTIPANTTATVSLPRAKAEELKLNASPLNSEMKKRIQQSANELVIELGSGNYRFSYPAAGF
ncbi:glycoside hydrolase family 78 protein [Gaoshiqia sp. Z1-71]|uniref:glycoside hydrolase family 78 protein n=1 Tax=Gaoshiqia hydrogeniformans TaxID=3290090 RepID=UPI003BF80767